MSQNEDYAPSVIQAGEHVLKSITLINGGAAIAILTLFKSESCNSAANVSDWLIWSVAFFSLGILFASFTVGCTFFSRWYKVENESKSKEKIFRNSGYFTTLISYLCFLVGVFYACKSFI